MAVTELFAASLAATTVSSGGTDAPSSGTVETWTVASSAMFGAAATGVSQFHVADAASGKGTEMIAVTNVSGTTWTVTRGAESTTPVTHAEGFMIYQVTTAGWLGGVAQLASPVFTGTPAAPTAPPLTDDTQLATTAYADSAVAVEASRAEAAEALLVPLSDLPLSIAHGGTGQPAQQAALNALSGTQTAGYVLGSDGTNVKMVPDSGVTIKVPAPAGMTATDTPAVEAAITSLAAALASGPATLQFQDGTYQVDSNSLVIRSPDTTTVAVASNGAEPGTWVTGSTGTLAVASASGFPSPGQLWLAASGNTTALISYAGTTGTTFTGCVYLSGSPSGTLATGGAVTGVLANFAVKGTGATVIKQAPNRAGLVNNVTGDLFVIADCTDFRVEGITFDGMRDTVAPITPLTASASSGQPSVTVASGQGSRYLAGQYLYLFGGLGTAEQNQSDGFGVGSGTPLVVSSITTGGGSGGGDLVTFTTNLANSYAQISSTLVSDGFGPYACDGAYLTPYQCGYSNSVAGRTLSGEDQQNGLHLISCQRFTVSRVEARNLWESPVKTGTGYTASVLTDGCSQGSITGCTAYHAYDQGISLWNTSSVTVTGNTVNSCGWAGISMSAWSDYNTVTANVILNSVYRVPDDTGSGSGIAVEGGRGNQIAGNTITGVYDIGIQLRAAPFVTTLNSSNSPTTSAYLEGGTAAGTSVQVSATSALEAGLPVSILDGHRTEALTIASVVDSTHVTFAETLAYSHAAAVYVMPRVSQENTVSGNTIVNAGNHAVNGALSVRTAYKGNIIRNWGSASTGMTFDGVNPGVEGLPSGQVLGGNGSRIEGNQLASTGNGDAIRTNGVDGFIITGNTISGPFSATTNSGLNLFGITDSVISGNRISDTLGGTSGSWGIALSDGGTSGAVACARVTIEANVIRNTSAEGIIVTVGDSLTITGNVISSCGGKGAIVLAGVTNSAITGNVCNSNQNNGIYLEDSGSAYCLNNRITGNTARDDGSGASIKTGTGWTQQYGIQETGHSNYNLITGNECDSNAVSQIVTTGSGTEVYANIISGTPSGLPIVNPLTTPGDLLYENATPAPARLAIGSAGHVLGVSSGLPAWQPGMTLQATTGIGGYALVNGTGNIISWTPPNDGNMHRSVVFALLGTTVNQTGGEIAIEFYSPSGTGGNLAFVLFDPNIAAGFNGITSWIAILSAPNEPVAITQYSALTGGAAVLYAEIWGS